MSDTTSTDTSQVRVSSPWWCAEDEYESLISQSKSQSDTIEALLQDPAMPPRDAIGGVYLLWLVDKDEDQFIPTPITKVGRTQNLVKRLVYYQKNGYRHVIPYAFVSETSVEVQKSMEKEVIEHFRERLSSVHGREYFRSSGGSDLQIFAHVITEACTRTQQPPVEGLSRDDACRLLQFVHRQYAPLDYLCLWQRTDGSYRVTRETSPLLSAMLGGDSLIAFHVEDNAYHTAVFTVPIGEDERLNVPRSVGLSTFFKMDVHDEKGYESPFLYGA